MLASQRANTSHWTLCSRWGSWKQNILYSETFSFFPSFPAASMEPREKASGEPCEGFFRLWSDVARTVRSYSHVWALKVPLRLSVHQRFTATHAWRAESYVWAGVGAGMDVNVAVLISCGILTGDIWCPSNQMAPPLLLQLQLWDQSWQQMGATNHSLTWKPFLLFHI